MRGKNLQLQSGTVVGRALSQIYVRPPRPPEAPDDWVSCLIQYRLEGGYNGGKDPSAPHCASWSFGDRVPTADCVGFALWSAGIDRLQPGYNGSRGEWLNCDSIIDDSHGAQKFFKPVGSLAGKPGDLLVMPSGDGAHGHIGVILAAGTHKNEVLVADCSPAHHPYNGVQDSDRFGAVGTRGIWSDTCVIVRPAWYS